MDVKLINDEWKRVKKGDVVVIHGDYTQEVYDYICNMYFRHPEKASFNNHIHILDLVYYVYILIHQQVQISYIK